MTSPLIKTSFASGEVAPALWGRSDLAQWHNGCSVGRNMFVNFRGGLSSRAGTAWVGPCGQAASAYPPRNIPFRFSTTQGYCLEFGDYYMRVVSNGAYVTQSPYAITGATNSLQCTLTVAGNDFSVGDLIYVSGVSGMAQINDRFFYVATNDGTNVGLANIFHLSANSQTFGAYVSGGSAARIYTVAAPYAAVDLPYLKYTQSADVMTLTCVNQATGTEYPPYDLERTSATSWAFVQTTYASAMTAPTNLTLTATSTTPPTTTPPTQLCWYAYCVTSVDAATGDESVASPVTYVQSVNIAAIAGSIIATWYPVAGASYYNIYKAPVSYDTQVPIGSVFGLAGTSYGTQFVDSNITQDFTKTPPTHQNPFARGQVISCFAVAWGSGYAQATTAANMSSATGSGAILAPVVVGGAVVAIIVENSGIGYVAGDTIVIAGAGSGANYTPQIGAETGTYPAVAGYFQSRRAYANTLNNPDTVYLSQTGRYTNMDAASPPVDSDAIIATPWGQQVNGVQWIVSMPGGMIVATGLDCWQMTGTGGAFSAITPSSQSAQAQETYGFSATVEPQKIGYNIIYLTSFNNAVRSLEYNFYANIYGGTDISFLSNHLFSDHVIKDWAWSQEPNKLLWAVREDGKLLSLTYLKEQQISGWCRHDTNGLVQSVAVVTEPPVDAVYVVVKRYVPGAGVWMYYQERMDNRLWDGPEDVWCVDAGLSLGQGFPNATLTASAADGPKSISGGTIITGGMDYTAPEVIVTDPSGQGSGAEITLNVVSGVVMGLSIVNPGEDYQAYHVVINDATGRGATMMLTISRAVNFTASASVFATGYVGSIIRMGGGMATVTVYNSPTSVTAQMTLPIVVTVPNDPNNLPVPAAFQEWSITEPISTLTNLEHLDGMQVACVADGSVMPAMTVVNGSITLPNPASSITVGLPFTAQAQGLHADVPGAATIQGRRKKISSTVVRLDRSRGVSLGANQPVASTQYKEQEIPWANMQELKDRNAQVQAGWAIPLFTGDKFIPVDDDWNLSDGEPSPGMVAAQQTYPMPMNLLALIYNIDVGDD